LETGFEGFYPAEVAAEGAIAINARTLYDIVRIFPSNEIEIKEVENHWIEISDSQVEYHIVGMNPEDFPEIPKIEGISFFEIEAQQLRSMIDKCVIIAGGSDDRRAHITGVYLESLDEEKQRLLRMVATDGSRLSKIDYVFQEQAAAPVEQGIIIPKKGLNEVNKFLATEEKVQIGSQNNNFIIKKENETIIIRLLEGDFPEYFEIVKKPDENQAIQIPRTPFLNTLKRMSIISSQDYRGVIFNLEENKLIVSSTNPDKGDSREQVPISYTGQKLEVAFNPRFFIETLNAIEEDQVLVYITSEEKPCLIEGQNDKRYLTAIMPMRI
jgi:DNA polymerase-3 subunit beta